MAGERVLVVEDDPGQRDLVVRVLEGAGYRVTAAPSAEDALTALSRGPIDLVLSDWKLPGLDGLGLLARVKSCYADTDVVMVTAYGTIAHAVRAVRDGASDYLTKPFERQALLLTLERVFNLRRLARENRRLAEELSERDRLVDLVGGSKVMASLFRRMEKIAGTDASVLIGGESGTGKELAARALHALSPRCERPLGAVNCEAIPETLVESELFGAEKGAYTGADRTRVGHFEAADGGTLFLDEIGELPLSSQPKLLRALQEGTVTRVGGVREQRVDLRIVAATNRDLVGEVAAGRFREDLYYRLNVVPIRMPALRDRREDVPRLIHHFTERAARRYGQPVLPFEAAVMRRLIDYPWPGNVRELANVVERLVLLAEDGRVHEDDLPQQGATAPSSREDWAVPTTGMSWDAHERSCLAQALDLAGGNRARAARLLDLPYKAFLYRLEKHGLR